MGVWAMEDLNCQKIQHLPQGSDKRKLDSDIAGILHLELCDSLDDSNLALYWVAMDYD